MSFRVPLVDLDSLHRPLREELLRALAGCIDRRNFILGAEVERFEEELAAYCEVPFALGVSSGTDALLVSLMAYGIGPGDEVVTSALSFFATAGVVSRLGATPIFADIEEESFQLDPLRVEERLSEKTRAILPVHLYGRAFEMDPILELAEERGLAVIEDAAQAIGARDSKGRRAGTVASVGTLSFYPTKNLGALGDAGMVLTREPGLFETLKRLRTHGGSREYLHETVGGNFRLDAFQAAVLRVKLPHVDEWNRRRNERARAYDRLLAESGLVREGLVRPPAIVPGHVFHQYVVRVRDRHRLREHLAAEGIGSGVYYPLPLHLQPCFRDLGYARGDFPIAETAAEEALALPMGPCLTDEQQELVVRAVAGFYGLA